MKLSGLFKKKAGRTGQAPASSLNEKKKKEEIKKDPKKEKFYSLALGWTIESSVKETDELLSAARAYFMPDKRILKKPDSGADRQDKIRLVLKGIALGDMAGEPYEGISAAKRTGNADPMLYKRLPFLQEYSHITDDTVMSYAVCRAALTIASEQRITTEGKLKVYITALRSFAKEYPAAGYGSHFYEWAVTGHIDPKYKSFGNGAAMRSGVIGAVFSGAKDVIENAVLSALPTHSHPEGIKGAVVTAAAVFLALNGASKEDIIGYMSHFYAKGQGETDYSIHCSNTIEHLSDPRTIACSMSSMITMPEAVILLHDSSDYESCMRNIFRFKCDADTVGAIAGGIAAALYGNTDIDGMDTDKEIRTRVPAKLRKAIEETKGEAI